ncbi:MAG: hypothetical protein ACK53L_26840, partial [Pirellulaceae bacterium]
ARERCVRVWESCVEIARSSQEKLPIAERVPPRRTCGLPQPGFCALAAEGSSGGVLSRRLLVEQSG